MTAVKKHDDDCTRRRSREGGKYICTCGMTDAAVARVVAQAEEQGIVFPVVQDDPVVKTDYTREELIAICEHAVVQQDLWNDRDSPSAQLGVGKAWALLKAGCEFHIIKSGNLNTDDKTIWVSITYKSFNSFEFGERNYDDEDTIYLPTPERLEMREGQDWY